YSYDNLHNLTRIDYPDRTYKAITYNSDKDWVMSFRNRRGCVETYTYDVDKQDPKDHYSSSVKKVCNKKVTNQSSYEFFHKDRGDGLGKYLYRVKSDNNGEISDVIYHEIFGKPISVINNKFKTSYTYYDNGLVKTKTEPLRSLFFKYDNKCKKVSEVDIRLFIPEGEGAESEDRKVSNIKKSKVSKREKPKLAKKVTSQFRYDSPKCNLVFAKNSDGQIAKMKYDSRGRISLIEDQSKKIVKVEYEERFGKPARVERPGLGTIKVTYKPSGEIDKVQSKDGPNVAVQVASIFNTLLEIIAPATTEASI
ncbi:MAG: cell wall-associated protein wapA, partial [Bdellovibrionales bacterium]|nr:cell wall-associated protein wapA [Bdellovibrionales bacterium]